MQIYLVKGYIDVAATSLVDAMALLAALANPSTSANSAAIARITGKLETLVQSDSGEPLVISSIDDTTGAISSWVTDSSVVISVGLGDLDTGNALAYASTLSLGIASGTRTGTLALNTAALANALRLRGFCGPGSASCFTLQIRKTYAGSTETVALLTISVSAGVLSSDPTSQIASPTYVTTSEARGGYLINLGAVTSMTGGGATTLDGQDAGSATFPVGCIVVTSDGDIGRQWKLKGSYIAATDLAVGLVKPTNSSAVLNPVHWKLIT
jgi:hypothetical protein